MHHFRHILINFLMADDETLTINFGPKTPSRGSTDTPYEPSDDQIQEKLAGFVEADIMTIPIGTFVRYFRIEKDGSRRFCPGGKLIHNANASKYVVLEEYRGKYSKTRQAPKSWSVTTSEAIFYRPLTQSEKADLDAAKNSQLEELKGRVSELETKLHEARKAASYWKKKYVDSQGK